MVVGDTIKKLVDLAQNEVDINNWIQIVLSRKLEKNHCNLNHWNQIETFITQGTKTPKMNLTVNQELTRCLAVTLNF